MCNYFEFGPVIKEEILLKICLHMVNLGKIICTVSVSENLPQPQRRSNKSLIIVQLMSDHKL